MNMKRIEKIVRLLMPFAICCLSYGAYACSSDNSNKPSDSWDVDCFISPHSLEFGGFIDSQYGYVNQKPEFRTPTPGSGGDQRIDQGLFTNSELFFNYAMKLNDSHEFGAQLILYSSIGRAKNGSRSNGKLIRFHYEGPSGRYEIGEMPGASIEMQKSANNIAKGTGGIDGDFDFYENPFTIDGARKDTIFVNYPYMPIGSDFNTRRFKLSYYTPKFNGLQFGISYTHDIDNFGTIANNLFLTDVVRTELGEDLVAYKNIVEGGFTYDLEHKDIGYEFSLLGQVGSSKRVPDGVPRDNLRAFEFGTIISHKEYSVAGSYGNWGESGTSSIKIPGAKYGAYYYTLGTAYEDQKFGASVTYLHSKRAGGSRVFPSGMGVATNVVNESTYNKLNLVSAGTDYKVTEGLKAYAEYTYFSYDRTETAIDNSGSIYVLGLKLSF